MFNFLSGMIAGMTKISVSFSSFFQKHGHQQHQINYIIILGKLVSRARES